MAFFAYSATKDIDMSTTEFIIKTSIVVVFGPIYLAVLLRWLLRTCYEEHFRYQVMLQRFKNNHDSL